jgi:hypothetical protein
MDQPRNPPDDRWMKKDNLSSHVFQLQAIVVRLSTGGKKVVGDIEVG